MALADHFFIDGDGLHLPDYPTILKEMQDAVRAIYGADTYLEPDSMDGQIVALVSLSYYDLTQVLAWVYASFPPHTAQGDALSRVVKINGIRRLIPTNSQVDVVIVGQAGTVINAGQVEDAAGNRWALPEVVTIPTEGEVTVTATAVEAGALTVAEGSITKIVTPTRGWQSVTNPTALLPSQAGNPVETDAELRRRQTVSTMIPSLSVMEGIVGAVAALDGVTRLRGYENDTNITDDDGVPGHTIALVVEGGDATEIATALHRKKTAGTGTYASADDLAGGTTVTVNDQFGVPTDINFIRPTPVTITVEVEITALTGYIGDTASAIASAVADYINALGIGEEVYLNRLYTPANLSGQWQPTSPLPVGGIPAPATFVIDSILIARGLDTPADADLTLAFNEVAVCTAAVDVTVTVA